MSTNNFIAFSVTIIALAFLPHAQAQSSVLKTNLIVNGNAESGNTGTAATPVASIPGWTRSGNANVFSYGMTGFLQTTDPAPPDHGFQYFYAGVPGAGPSTLTQSIDVSSGASIISAGNVKFTAAAYLGGAAQYGTAQVTVAFQNAKAQSFSTTTLGPLLLPGPNGLCLQQSIGLVPSGTVMITVTLSFSGPGAAADSLSLVLTQLGGSAGPVLGTNLVSNPGAEAGPALVIPAIAAYVPAWSTSNGLSVAPYGGTNWIQSTDPGPVDRGSKVFCRAIAGETASMYQDLDVSPAAALIDASQITYQISAWLGGLSGVGVTPTMTYTFYDWSGNQLGTTGKFGPDYVDGSSLVEVSGSGTLPSGTRRVHIQLDFSATMVADNISFILSAPNGPPVIDPGGIVNLTAFGGGLAVAQGSWIEIYGRNLASTTASWSGSDFNNGVGPTTLQGVSVSIGGQPAFVNYISPGQIDALLPSNAMTGAAPITVTNANGTSDPFYVAVSATQPSLLAPTAFLIGGKQYVAAFNPDGTFALPQNAIVGVSSTPATVGQTLVLYGIGFGPVSDGVTAGTLPAQQDSLTLPLVVSFGTATAQLAYAGLATGLTGLYQINVVVPQVPTNSAQPITFTLGTTKSSQTLYIAVK